MNSNFSVTGEIFLRQVVSLTSAANDLRIAPENLLQRLVSVVDENGDIGKNYCVMARVRSDQEIWLCDLNDGLINLAEEGIFSKRCFNPPGKPSLEENSVFVNVSRLTLESIISGQIGKNYQFRSIICFENDRLIQRTSKGCVPRFNGNYLVRAIYGNSRDLFENWMFVLSKAKCEWWSCRENPSAVDLSLGNLFINQNLFNWIKPQDKLSGLALQLRLHQDLNVGTRLKKIIQINAENFRELFKPIVVDYTNKNKPPFEIPKDYPEHYPSNSKLFNIFRPIKNRDIYGFSINDVNKCLCKLLRPDRDEKNLEDIRNNGGEEYFSNKLLLLILANRLFYFQIDTEMPASFPDNNEVVSWLNCVYCQQDSIKSVQNKLSYEILPFRFSKEHIATLFKILNEVIPPKNRSKPEIDKICKEKKCTYCGQEKNLGEK